MSVSMCGVCVSVEVWSVCEGACECEHVWSVCELGCL